LSQETRQQISNEAGQINELTSTALNRCGRTKIFRDYGWLFSVMVWTGL